MLEVFEFAPVAAADLAVLMPAAYGTLETGMTETVETNITGDGDPALIEAGGEAAGDETAAETGQMVV